MPRNREPGLGKLWGVVLVGGQSSRMGRDKAALPHPAGGTFLDHAIARLRELGCPVLLSGAAAVPARWAKEPRVSALRDPLADPGRNIDAGQKIDAGRKQAGPVVGLVAALQFAAAAGANGILVTPVDMPYLTSDDLRDLLANFTGSLPSEPPSEPLIGTFDKVQREPLVAIYPLAVLESLEQLAAGGDRSLNRWLATHPHRLHPLPAAASANVNTPAEYDRAIGSPPPSERRTPAPYEEKP